MKRLFERVKAMVKGYDFIATPPGATIKEQLEDRGMSQKEFASRMNMSEKHISKLINGEVQLTTDVAIRLETVLGVPAQFWIKLEAVYREKLLKHLAESAMNNNIEIARQFPYAEMAQYGWVPATRKVEEKAEYLRRYFEVVDLTLLENQQITKIACRRLAVTKKSDLALMAFAQRAKLVARGIKTSAIDVKKLKAEISTIRSYTLTTPDAFCTDLINRLSDCGIALVFLPSLRGSYLHGATFVDGSKIVMGITDRGADADRFWFSLFHEIAHVVLGHINHSGELTKEDEDAADNWAADNLIPPMAYEQFKRRGSFYESDILRFAKDQMIAPGIVVGRLQKEGAIGHNHLNNLKEQYVIAAN